MHTLHNYFLIFGEAMELTHQLVYLMLNVTDFCTISFRRSIICLPRSELVWGCFDSISINLWPVDNFLCLMLYYKRS